MDGIVHQDITLTFDEDDQRTLAWICQGVIQGSGPFGPAQETFARQLLDYIPMQRHPSKEEWEQHTTGDRL